MGRGKKRKKGTATGEVKKWTAELVTLPRLVDYNSETLLCLRIDYGLINSKTKSFGGTVWRKRRKKKSFPFFYSKIRKENRFFFYCTSCSRNWIKSEKDRTIRNPITFFFFSFSSNLLIAHFFLKKRSNHIKRIPQSRSSAFLFKATSLKYIWQEPFSFFKVACQFCFVCPIIYKIKSRSSGKRLF